MVLKEIQVIGIQDMKWTVFFPQPSHVYDSYSFIYMVRVGTSTSLQLLECCSDNVEAFL